MVRQSVQGHRAEGRALSFREEQRERSRGGDDLSNNHVNLRGRTDLNHGSRTSCDTRQQGFRQQGQCRQLDCLSLNYTMSSRNGVNVERRNEVLWSDMSPWKQATSPALYCATSTCKRRNQVYDSIMGQWEQAASSYAPSPRSSHRRVLGGKALPARQRGESCSRESGNRTRQSTWRSLSDKVSPAAQSAWREQLLQRKLNRLAGVPMTVLLRQQGLRDGSSTAATEAFRVVASSGNRSAKLTALEVIDGTCQDVPIPLAPSPSPATTTSPSAVAGLNEGARREFTTASLGSLRTETVQWRQHIRQQQQQQQQQQLLKDMNAVSNRLRGDEKTFVEEPREDGSVCGQVCASASAASVVNGRSTSNGETRGRVLPRSTPLSPPQVKPPVRGFHLVDLHAVVRNSVEWGHLLPKVEPCFRVGSNRDGVLLGLVHALGGRLSCSSAHDVKAAVRAARRASPVQAPPPRLLDEHMCRPPGMLRASVAAGPQLYEVDSVDEWLRIRAAHKKLELSGGTFSRNETADKSTGTISPHPRGPGLDSDSTRASVVVKLAVPHQWKQEQLSAGSVAPMGADISGALEAAYGAGAEDVVKLVQTVTSAQVGEEDSSGNGGLPIVGFCIDVGSACRDDVLAGNAAALAPSADEFSCSTPASTNASLAGETTGEAVPSAYLAGRIDAAVAFAVKMSRTAEEASASAAIAKPVPRAAAACLGDAEADQGHGASVGNADLDSAPRPATATPNTNSCYPLPTPFSFQRLHVTGLGEGGARGEPLAALKAALARHLPAATAAATTPCGGEGSDSRSEGTLPPRAPTARPIAVSADATEYLMWGGVWSTVTSIIGRKMVPPAAANAHHSPTTQFPTDVGRADGSEVSGAGGAMYYIDDGCYGSLSGALLRGVQMHPLPLRASLHKPPRNLHSVSKHVAAAPTVAVPGKICSDRVSGSGTYAGDGSALRSGAPSEPKMPCEEGLASCTVWGPTCDGLDCVCRTTRLPDDMEPGRDWLFFSDVGIRSAADTTDFNGLTPLDSLYCIRQYENHAALAAP